jgi:hypothetical protein
VKSRDYLRASTSTPAPEGPIVEALRVLTAAPNLFDAIEAYLSNPATSPIVRRMIGHILVLGEQLATAPAVIL